MGMSYQYGLHVARTSTDAVNLNRQLYQVALGLVYLHAEGIIHGDLHGVSICSWLTRFLTISSHVTG